MKHDDHFADNSYGSWHTLGDLELSIESNPVSATIAWLANLLKPLNLHADFQNRILISASEAVERAMYAQNTMIIDHVCLVVYTSTDANRNQQTWGFFRIEKIEEPDGDSNVTDHTIELYLYVDRE